MKQLSRTRTYAERKITNSKRGQSRLEWLTAIEPVEDHHTGKRHHGLVLLWSLSDKRPREISVGNHWPVWEKGRGTKPDKRVTKNHIQYNNKMLQCPVLQQYKGRLCITKSVEWTETVTRKKHNEQMRLECSSECWMTVNVSNCDRKTVPDVRTADREMHAFQTRCPSYRTTAALVVELSWRRCGSVTL